MIINAKRKDLLSQARKTAQAAVSGHSIMELSGVLIEADERACLVRMTSTNLEVAIQTTFPATVEKSGKALIDAKLFLEILDRLPGENIYMELQNNGYLRFNSEQAEFTVMTLPGAKFPKVEIPYPGNTVSVKGLKSLINRTVFAVSADKSRKDLACVNLVFSKNGVRAIACDGYSAVQATGDPEGKGNISLLVPGTSLKLLASIAGDTDLYELGVTGHDGVSKSVVISDGFTLFSARLIEGQFVDTDKVMDGLSLTATARISAKKLRQALDSLTGVASSESAVEISFGDGGLILKCESNLGRVTSKAEAAVTDPTGETYHYRLQKLLASVKTLNGDVTLSFANTKEIVMHNDSVRYLQLGMRPIEKKQPEQTPAKSSLKKPKKASTQKEAA